MHYLKCSKCGHFNEVLTQDMVNCSICNKKLAKNYPDWILENPAKSFEEYKRIICTTKPQNNLKDKSSSFKSKNLTFLIGFAFVVAFAIFYLIGHFGGTKVAGLFKSYDKVMKETAIEVNKTCPTMIDYMTRLDNATVLPNNVFQYNYTLITMVKDSINIDGLKKYLEPNITSFVKTNPIMKTMRDHKTTINYFYKDKVGSYLFTIAIDPEKYK